MRKEGFLVFFIFLFLMSPFSMANALTVKLDPASVTLPAPGNTFNINVLIENVTDLGGFQFDINYNPSIVTIVDASAVTLGSFLGSTGRSTSPLGPTIDNVTGKVTYGAFSFGTNPGPNGNGILATITFIVQSQANGILDLNNVQVADTVANVLTIDTVGDATLSISTVPDITVTDSVPPVDDLQVPFGDITEGNSSNQTITITNSGNADLIIGNIAQADPLGGPFDILNDNCSGQAIAPAGTCNLGVSFSPTTTGSFTDTFDIPSNDPDENPVTISLSGTGSSGGGENGGGGTCFIATAAFGSSLDPHVKVLRDFRDKYLITNPFGKAFVMFYYKVSPQLADYIRTHETLRIVTRFSLTPIVYGVKYPQIALLLIALSIGFVSFRRRRRW
jgi:hypothetical protein